MFHFQDRDGREVDCVLETPAGRVVGIEVKAAATVRSDDFRHLATLRNRIGPEFVAGIVFFTGERPLPFGDRLLALPISALWGGRPAPTSNSHVLDVGVDVQPDGGPTSTSQPSGTRCGHRPD